MSLTEDVKAFAREQGADLVGLAPDRGASSGAPCTGLLRPAADATA